MNKYCDFNCPKYQEIKNKILEKSDSVFDAAIDVIEEVDRICGDNCTYKKEKGNKDEGNNQTNEK